MDERDPNLFEAGQSVEVIVDTQLTGDAAITLCRRLGASVLARTASTLSLYLGRVDALDASGVAALVRLHSQLIVSRRRLELVGVRPEVAARLKRLGLDQLIEIKSAEAPGLWPHRLVTTLP